MKRSSTLRWIALVALLALIAAACGGTDDSGPETTVGSEETSAPDTTAAPDDEETTDTGDDEETTETTTASTGELDTVTWISPRGTLEVMDDYNLWVPIEMGYFEELGIEVELIAGPADATAPTKFVAEEQADIGYPSPGVLTSSIDAGVEVTSIYNMISRQVFNFALHPDSDIETVDDLRGRTISLWAAGGQVVSDPILYEAGIDPSEVEYVEGGAQWGQIVALGQADAALGWDGLRAQWDAQGLELRWLLGREFSEHPSNVYSVRTSDLETEEGRDLWTRFLKGVVMGKEFARANPRAAAQITYNNLSDLSATVEPELALASMLELAEAYSASERAGDGWGHHDSAGWENYLSVIAELGQTSETLDPSDVYTNDLLEEANNIDLDRVQSDAESFELDETFSDMTVPDGYDY